MNRALTTSLISILAAQAFKIPAQLRQEGKWEWRDLARTGGMPSAHSAGVASMAAYLGRKKGFHSPYFAMATMLGLIVMFDAMGIRRHAGLIATEVNELGETVVRLSEEHPPHAYPRRKKELEEQLGHLPVEVLGGAALGSAIGLLSAWLEGGPQAGSEPSEPWRPFTRKR